MNGCRRLRTNDIKDMASKKIDNGDYEIARDEAFHEYWCKVINDNDNFEHIWTEEDVKIYLNDFKFPNEDEWAIDEIISDYESHCEDMADMARDEMMMERNNDG